MVIQPLVQKVESILLTCEYRQYFILLACDTPQGSVIISCVSQSYTDSEIDVVEAALYQVVQEFGLEMQNYIKNKV